MILTSLKLLSATVVALAGYGASTQYFNAKYDAEHYLPIGQMVDIGGYSLHMVDSATCDLMNLYNEDLTAAHASKFTVVMDAGFACNCLDWSLVQPEIARFCRVITYDRAGYAWSDASPLERTSKNIVQELHAMLQAAQIKGPYILVGHSFGGCNMQMYAMQYPDEVAGLVLVDSVHEDQVDVLRPPATQYFQLLTGAVYLGAFRFMAHIPVVCDLMKEHIAKLPDHIQEIYYSQSMTNKHADTLRAEAYFAPEDCKQLKECAPTLADIPLIVVSAGKPFISDDKAEHFYTPDQIKHVNEQWPVLQANLAKKSARSVHIIAHESGHRIPIDQPEIIVDAVRQMIEQIS
jgi:pimeloyl-ACP methyl ester carboxylesterase